MSGRKSVKSSELRLARTTLGTTIGDTTKDVVDMEGFVVNVGQGSTSDLMFLSILRLLETIRNPQLMIQSMRQLFMEASMEEGDMAALDPTAMLVTTSTGMGIRNSIHMAIRIVAPSSRNLFRMEFAIRTVTDDSALDPGGKEQRKLCCVVMPLGFDRSFLGLRVPAMTLMFLEELRMHRWNRTKQRKQLRHERIPMQLELMQSLFEAS